jgi:ATP-dependent RNA helicase DDX54/DBP10
MAGQKRKRSQKHAEGDESDFSIVALSEDEVDISSALTGKHAKKDWVDEVDEEEDLSEMIQDYIAKRNVKTGTDVLKKAKGKAKMVKGEIGGGSFQSMGKCPQLFLDEPMSQKILGLHASLLRSLTLQGYRIPTPIQRLSIPALLANPPRDLVGMARTGSGKSLAYMVPLVQRLGGRHSTTFGARSLILLPTRELALQILRVGKELARGWHGGSGGHAGDGKETEDKKGQSLRWGLIVGGEGLDEQFEMITDNPDMFVGFFQRKSVLINMCPILV